MRRGREGTSSSDLVTAGTESTVLAPVVSFGFVSQNKSNKHFMVLGCFIDKLAFETPTFYDHSLNLCSLSPVASLGTLLVLFFLRVLVFPLVFVLVFLLAFPLVSFLVLLEVSGLVFLLASLVGRCAFSHPRLKPSSPFYLDCLDVVCSVCLLTTCLPFVSLLVSVFVSLHAFLVFILFSPCPCLDF